MSLLELVQRRLVIVTGKGGVGKSTVAAALGRAFASMGKRVLLAEIAPDANTPSQLERALGSAPPSEDPAEIAEGLSVALLTPSVGHLRFLQDALPLKVLADTAMKSQGLRKFLSAAPGFSDMGVMYRMLDLLHRTTHVGLPRYEICVIDSPATGHALALAQIPEFLTRVIPAGPIARAAREGVSILTDPKTTGCVVVTLPETLPVTEALELERGLARHRLAVSAVVLNRVPVDPFLPEERRALDSLLNEKVFGTRELKRLDRARAAVSFIERERPTGLFVLPEVRAIGAEVTNELAPLMRLGTMR